MTAYNAQQHIHLYLTTTTFSHDTTQFHVMFGGLQENTGVIAMHKRALDGTGHLHSLNDDTTGAPVQFKNANLTILATQAEFETLKGLQGQRCYFFPNRHMEDSTDHVNDGTGLPETPGYRVVLMPIGENGAIDAPLEYWRVNISLLDDEAKA
jgi:hypothetical protein